MLNKTIEWAINHSNDIKTATIALSALTITAIITPTVLTMGTKLVMTGAFLCAGFWAGKKVTNTIDIWLATHNQQLLKDIEQELRS